MSPGWVTPQCHFGVPRLLGDGSRAQPHSPIEGGAGAVIDHLAVALHLQIRLAVVTAIILKLVDGLRGQGPAGSRVAAGPGRRVQGQGRGGREAPGDCREAGEGERPGQGRAVEGAGRPGRRDRPGGGKTRKVQAGEGGEGREGPGPGGPKRAGKRPRRAEKLGPGPRMRRDSAGKGRGRQGAIPVAAPVPFPVPP